MNDNLENERNNVFRTNEKTLTKLVIHEQKMNELKANAPISTV